jgi:beta-galactosidase
VHYNDKRTKRFSLVYVIKLCTFLLVSTLMFACEQARIAPALDLKIKASQIELNHNWQFSQSTPELSITETDLLTWQNIDLPHTPQIEPMVVNNQWQGIAWYRKDFKGDAKWRGQKVFLRIEAAMNKAQVWLNGELLGTHLGGYLPFTFDISAKLNSEKTNVLLLRLDNNDDPLIGPKPVKTLDFNTYGGLYRGVSLDLKSALYISDEMLANKTASGGVFVTYPKVSEAESQIQVKTHIVNEHATAQTFIVRQRLSFADKLVTQVEQQQILKASSNEQISQHLEVLQAALWHPNHPNLYTLTTILEHDGQVIESQSRKIGIREFAFSQKHQLLINGKVFFLRGVNRHQEYPHVGYAISPQADYRDAVKIKSAGFDYVRLSHYPHSEAFMRAADELGLVLIDAVLGWQYFLEDPRFKSQIIRTCRDLVRRDRNYASVLAFECSLNESWMPEAFIADLHAMVKQEYPTAFSAGWQMGYDMYLQARQHRLEHYETPTLPYNVSEYGDWEYYAHNAGLNQDNWGDLQEEARTSRQLLNAGETRLLQQVRNIQEAHNDNLKTPAFADGYWVMFDYNRGYAEDLEASGIMSIYRLPKYSYYFFQSQRSAELHSNAYTSGPMVKIASEWTVDSNLDVRVFSNAQEVELWLNGELIERQTPTQNSLSDKLVHPPFEFSVPKFMVGDLVAKAFINEILVASDQVSTPGSVVELNLRIDTSGVTPVAGQNDVIFAYAELIDQKGNKVPINGQQINFKVTGDLEIMNPEPALTEQGSAAVLVRIGRSLAGASILAQIEASNVVSPVLKLSQ